MKNTKTTCHICTLTMETIAGQEEPTFCEYCGTNVINQEETSIRTAAIATEAGGIKADIVTVILTNKRIIFTGKESSNSAWWGWFLGGLIGGLIVGAISSAKGKQQLVSVKFEDMKGLDVTFGTGMFNKNSKILTITDNSGTEFSFQPDKKETEQWEDDIRKSLDNR